MGYMHVVSPAAKCPPVKWIRQVQPPPKLSNNCKVPVREKQGCRNGKGAEKERNMERCHCGDAMACLKDWGLRTVASMLAWDPCTGVCWPAVFRFAFGRGWKLGVAGGGPHGGAWLEEEPCVPPCMPFFLFTR
eukprot:349741-Chlamydomonas_euryale.AAC.1